MSYCPVERNWMSSLKCAAINEFVTWFKARLSPFPPLIRKRIRATSQKLRNSEREFFSLNFESSQNSDFNLRILGGKSELFPMCLKLNSYIWPLSSAVPLWEFVYYPLLNLICCCVIVATYSLFWWLVFVVSCLWLLSSSLFDFLVSIKFPPN